MSKPILYGTPVSPPVRSILVFLKANNALDKIEFQNINLFTGEHLSPSFVELTSGFHQVPALKDPESGLVLFESPAIIQYLAEKFKLSGDFGIPQDDIVKKYKVINMLHKHPNFIAPVFREINESFFAAFMGTAPFDLEKVKAGIEKAKGAQFKLLNDILGKNNGYITGFPSAADIPVWVELFCLAKGDFPADDYTTLHVYDFEEFPNIVTWIKNLKDRLFVKDDEIWLAVAEINKKGCATDAKAIRLADRLLDNQ